MENKVVLSTRWIVKYTDGQEVIENPNALPRLLGWLKNFKKVATVTLTEIRTCSAMPGVEWKQEVTIDMSKFQAMPGNPIAPYVDDLSTALQVSGFVK